MFPQTYNHHYKDAFKSDLLNFNDHLEIHSWYFSPLKVFSLSTTVCGISSELISSCRVKMPFEPNISSLFFPLQTHTDNSYDNHKGESESKDAIRAKYFQPFFSLQNHFRIILKIII